MVETYIEYKNTKFESPAKIHSFSIYIGFHHTEPPTGTGIPTTPRAWGILLCCFLHLHEFATYYQLTMPVIPPVYMRSSAAIWRRSGQSSGRRIHLARTCLLLATIWRHLAGSGGNWRVPFIFIYFLYFLGLTCGLTQIATLTAPYSWSLWWLGPMGTTYWGEINRLSRCKLSWWKPI